MENNSTEHISNEDLQFVFDNILKKMTKCLANKLTESNSNILTEESKHLAVIMFNKFKIQFYSVMNLTYNMTTDMEKKYEYLDIASIHTIIRGCYETYLTYYYIYMMPNSFKIDYKKLNYSDLEFYKDSINLKILLYRYEGANQSSKLKQTIKGSKDNSININEIRKDLQNNKIFRSLSNKIKNEYFKNWIPSWNYIAKNTLLSDWNSRGQYNLLSQYGHNSYNALCQLNHYYQKLYLYDRDAMNTQLYEFTSLFIENLLWLFEIDIHILTTDEINILGEFKYMATLNAEDFSKPK